MRGYDPATMKIHLFPAILACLLITERPVTAVTEIGETRRFLFHSISEGLYEDGVATEDVERILLLRENEHYFHFIHTCPVCMAAVWAFDAYRHRPAKLHCVKSGASTFGPGLDQKLREALHSDDAERRLAAINTLIGDWIDRRMDRLRLTEKERADLRQRLQEMREQGMAMLKQFRLQEKDGAAVAVYAPAYLDRPDWECAVCRAAVGKPMKIAEENEPGPGKGTDPGAEGSDR